MHAREKKDLIFPSSLEILEVAVCSKEFIKDEEASTEYKVVNVPREPSIVFHYSAQNQGGSRSDSLVMFSWEDGRYIKGTTIKSLDEVPPSYLSGDEWNDYVTAQMLMNYTLTMGNTNIDIIDKSRLARLNDVNRATNMTDINFIAYNDIVPEPTPQVIECTPAPTTP